MFKELAPIARRAPIAIMIITEGDHLRVTIQQKADKLKDGAIPLAISVAQTPEVLDAELPGAIELASNTAQSAESVLDQVRKQTERATEAAKAAGVKKAEKTKRSVRKPAKAAVKRKSAGPKPKKTPAAQPAKKPTAEKSTKHIASKPNKDQCIADYHAYAAAHPGEPIKREPFMKGSATGRRFERLFGNWEKFVKAALKSGTWNPPDDRKTRPLPLDPAVTTSPQEAEQLARNIIASRVPAQARDDGKAPVTGIGYSVYRKNTGDLIGGIVRDPDAAPEDGDIIKLHDGSEWMIQSVSGNQIIAHAWSPPADGKLPGLPESWPFPPPPAQIDVSAMPTATGRTVITRTGIPLAGNVTVAAETGAAIDIPGHGMHRITDFDDQQIVVEPITEGATA